MRLTSRRTARFLAILLAMGAFSQPARSQDAPRREAPSNESKGLPARAAASEYQAQAQAGPITLAADFVGHSVPTRDGTYSSKEFVVLEVALFGPPELRATLSNGDFSLRIGKKTALPSQPYERVRNTLEDPEWAPPSKPEAKSKTNLTSGGGGDAPATPVHMPMDLRLAMEQRVRDSAILQGERALPQAGLLFFEYHGKTENARPVELIYSGPTGKATLTLAP